MTNEEFEEFIESIRECAYFVSGYKCNIDCEPCPFALLDGKMDWLDACEKCKELKKSVKSIAYFNKEEYEKYKQLTQEQRKKYWEYFGCEQPEWDKEDN